MAKVASEDVWLSVIGRSLAYLCLEQAKKLEPKKFDTVRKKVDFLLDSHVASLLVARDNGINYAPFATAEDRVEMRHASATAHIPLDPPSAPLAVRPAGKKLGKTKVKATKDNSMFVVHGRDAKLNQDMYAFLSSIGIVHGL